MIHDSPEDLQQAARRYGRDVGDECPACVHPAPVRERLVNGEWVASNPATWAGVVRFSKGWITTEIVGHEMIHAALVIYRMDVCDDVRLGNGVGKREETLAYIAGDLIGAASTMLHDAGIWR